MENRISHGLLSLSLQLTSFVYCSLLFQPIGLSIFFWFSLSIVTSINYSKKSADSLVKSFFLIKNCLSWPFSPMILHICQNPQVFSGEILKSVASAGLSKLMMVSSTFCEDQIQVSFFSSFFGPVQYFFTNIWKKFQRSGPPIVLKESYVSKIIWSR